MNYAISVQEDTFLHDLALSSPDVVEKVAALSLEEPQMEAPIVHRFGPGIYIREMHMKAGAFVIGKVHKHPHMNIVLTGSCVYYTSEGERREITAPASMVTPAGRKMAIFLEDTVWLNVYSTDLKDVEAIEKEFFEDSEALTERESDLASSYEDVVAVEREDFKEACAYLGLTPEIISEASSDESDLIPFPDGSYSVMVKPSMIHGKGLFATAPIKRGDFIAHARIDRKRTPAGRYTNHSALPNAEMVMDDAGNVGLYAMEDIGGSLGGLMGDEILVNYIDAFLDTRIEE